MTHQISIKYLKVASGILIGFGLLFFISLFTSADIIARFLIDLVFLPVDNAQTLATKESRLLMAISGGISVGWGITLWMITTNVYSDNPMIGKKIILTSIIAWFIVDSLGSIISGAWFNVVLNTFFLFAFTVPILLTNKIYVSDTSTAK